MAGSFTDFAENGVLDTVFGAEETFSTSAHPNLYFSLWRSTGASVGDAMTGATTGECAGSTYARVAHANTTANWAHSTAGVKLLKVACTMTTAAGSDWGTIGAIGIGTSGVSAGNIIVWSTLTGGAKVINSGDTVVVSTGYSITVT